LTERIPLAKVEREEEADTWRLIRRIDDWRRRIERGRVAIGPIHTPAALVIPFTLVSAALVLAALILAALVLPFTLVPAALLLPLAPVVILAERRHHGETADHRGEGEYHHDLADCRA
jgi:fatty acid desaturase